MKPKTKKVLLSFPEPLLKKVDAAARAQKRTRTAEVLLRLETTLKRPQAELSA